MIVLNKDDGHRPVNVLLIEDSRTVVGIVQRDLEAQRRPGFRVTCADRLSAGLERLARGGIDVVLLDLGLPDSNGLDTLRRTLDRAPDVPVVVLTGQEDQETGASALQMGAQDYLFKTGTASELLARVLRYAIERHGIRRQLRLAKEASAHRLEAVEMVGRIVVKRSDLQAGVDAAVTDALRAVGELVGAFRCSLILFSGDRTLASITHEWRAEGHRPWTESHKTMPLAVFPWGMDRSSRQKVIRIPLVADLPPEASNEKEMLEQLGAESSLLAPLTRGQDLIGGVHLCWKRADCPDMDTAAALLSSVGHILEGMLAYRDLAGAHEQIQQKYRALFNAVDAAFVHDQGGYFSEVNAAMCLWLGYTREELQKKKIQEIELPAPTRTVLDEAERLLSVGRVVCRRTFVARSGERIPVEVCNQLVPCGDGQMVLGVACRVTQEAP